MAKKCYYCSYPNRDDATRCVNCGIELNKYWDTSEGGISLVDKRRK